ncbi:PEGA domain-containing protein [Candidatus Gottesmanbacteria bacterium]|nr:PEGA domain-containing protein [Candidatus Gottesmanbacteria bacterium]
MRKFFFPILIIAILAFATVVVIAFGRGYRPNFGKRTIFSTGLLVATSSPDGAQIWLDGNLKSATNTTLTLPPGWYQVKLVKEGYLPWEKKMKIQGEVVSETKALLFPSTPTLTPLTTSGVIAPTLSPDGTKIIYAIPKANPKAGLWVLNLASQPLGFSRDHQLLARTTTMIDYSLGTFSWSPDSKQILVAIGANHYLVEAERENQPISLTREAWEKQVMSWQEEEKIKEEERLGLLPPEFVKIASESSKILAFSPDETKILYQATASATLPQILTPVPIATNPTPEARELKPGKIYVYDTKEDKNYEIGNWKLEIGNLFWFPTSRHLIEVTSDKISILEYDGTNKVTIYSGPFEKFVAALPSGGKLLILTSYNRPGPPAGGLPNLYSVNLR